MVALVISVFKTGVGIHPEWHRLFDGAVHWADVAASPLLAEGDRALRSNVLTSWLAGTLGAQSPRRYLALSFPLSLLAIALPVLLAARRDSRPALDWRTCSWWLNRCPRSPWPGSVATTR